MFLGADTHFFPPGSLDGFDLGLRVGLSSIKQEVTASGPGGTVTISESNSGIFFAPRVGYDYKFSRFSAGGEFVYTFASINSFSIQVAAKFWF